MANIAISALPAVTTPLAGTEILPAVQSSATKRVTIAEIASYIGSYTLPVATATVLGGVKQGTNTTIAADGTISVATGAGYSYTLPVATDTVLGGVKQGTNTTIAADGTISVATGAGYSYTLPTASDTVLGGIKVGTGLSIDGSSVLSSTITQYTDASARAAISVGGSLSYNSTTGVISYTTPAAYSLPVATDTVLGGVKQGTNTTIAADGTISVATGAGYSYTLPVATSSVLGGVKQGTGLTIDPNGVISTSARVSSTTTITSPLAWTSNSYDQYILTGLDNDLIINADSSTPVDGQKMVFRFKDNGTAQELTWTIDVNKAFRAMGVTLPTTTVVNKSLYVGCIYNAADLRWDVVAVAQEA